MAALTIEADTGLALKACRRMSVKRGPKVTPNKKRPRFTGAFEIKYVIARKEAIARRKA